MSLTIYFDGVGPQPNGEVQMDAEAFFTKVRLDGGTYDKAILRDIEKATFVNNMEYIDRFGRTLPRKFLSTGTKIALALYHQPWVVLNGAELGANALAAIVKHCSCGYLFMPAINYHVPCDFEDSAIDVVCHGKNYTSLEEFSEYMMEDAPYD